MPPRNPGIAIVGGGCSGLLVAVQLFRNGFRGCVTIIEPRDRLGSGLAYSGFGKRPIPYLSYVDYA
jgi:uncharacterized NAD(P)/FAD-binding protein YdhS